MAAEPPAPRGAPASGPADAPRARSAAPEPPRKPRSQAPAPPRPAATVVVEPPKPTRAPVGVGSIINNNYRITEVIKSGGMGQVFRGVTIGNEVPVAIKTVLPEHEQVKAVNDLFRKESAILVRLSVDGIVRYFNYLYDETNRRGFLIMEFIEGASLSDHLEAHGGLTLEQAVHLFRRLAEALDRAHAEEIVHRDLSPDNVMLRDSDIEKAVLIDFGIAKAGGVQKDVTVGVGAGKYKFMAPEQLGMFQGHIGPWTDVYGLALLMVAACRGKALDMGSNPVDAVDARRAEPDLSQVAQALRPLLRDMLQPDPENRPRSMKAVLSRLPAPGALNTTEATAPPLAATGTGLMDRPSTVPGLRMRPNMATMSGTRSGLGNGTHGATGLGTQSGTTGLGGTQLGRGSGPASARRGWIGPVLAVAALAVTGAFLAPQILPLVTGTPDTTASAPTESRAPAIEQFFASHDMATCSYAKLGTDRDSQGLVEIFSNSPGQGPALQEALDQSQNMVTGIVDRPVSADQCAVLNTSRRLQARTAVPIDIQMETKFEPESGRLTLGAEITDPLDRGLWVAVVQPNGKMIRVPASALSNTDGISRFAETYTVGVRGVPFLVFVLATQEPIARLAAFSDTDAAQAMGVIEAELQKAGTTDQSAVRVGYVFVQ